MSVRRLLLLIVLGIGLEAAGGRAADLYWTDSGTWDTTSQNWGVVSGGSYDQATWSNAASDSAIFQGTAGTVTLGTGITAAGVTFAVDGYTVTGNTLTLSGTPTVTTAAGATATIASVVGGTNGLTTAGDGTLVLSASNTYSGGTTVSAGTLQVNTTASLQGSVSVSSGATLLLNQDGVTWGNTITGGGTVTLNLSGDGNTYLSGLGGFGGTIRLANDGSTTNKWRIDSSYTAASATVEIDSGSSIYTPFGGTITFSGIRMSGTGNTEDRGAIRNEGNATFNAPITLLGSTTLTGGGTFSGTITSGVAGTSTLTLGTGNAGSSSNFSGTISDGTGAVGITAAFGNPLLSGTNSYSGATTVNSGATLRIGSGFAIPSGAGKGDVAVAGTLNLNNFGVSVNGLTGSGTVTNAQSGSVVLTLGNADWSGTFGGVIQNGSGTVGVTKVGTGTAIFTGSSTYTGATTISAGTLQFGSGGNSSATLPSGTVGGTGNLVATAQDITLGGAVSLSGSGAVSITQTNAGAFPNEINLASGSRTITAASITLSGDVGNNGSDGGSLALDTSAANGAMNLNVSLGRNGVTFIPASFSANAGTGVITVSGTGPGSSGWRNTPVTLTGDMNITAAVNSGVAVTLNQSAADPGVVSGVLSGGMSLAKGGAGTLAATAVNTFSGGLVINSGTFQAASGTSGNESALGARGNAITVNAVGRLEFTANRGAGFHNGSVAVNGGRISFTSSDNSLASSNTVTLGTAAGTIDGGGMWRFRGGATLRVLAAANGSTLSTSTVDFTEGNQTFNVDAGATLTVSSGFTNFNGGVYNKAGGGTMRITAVQSNYGSSVTVNSGTLDIAVGTSSGSASGLGSGGNTVAVGNGARLLFSGGGRTAGYHSGTVTLNNGTITFNTDDNSFASGRTLTLDVGPGTIDGTGQWRRRDGNNRITVTAAASGSVISVAELNLLDNSPVFEVANGSQANDLTISGGITGGSTLTKTGTGTLAVTGSNTSFSGATAINAGTLLVGNASALGTGGGITIGASGTLGVDAGVAFSRPLTLTAGGRVNLGDGASVALPSAAALAAFESMSPFAALTGARILSGSGSTTPSALTSGWVAKPSAGYFSDILSLDGTGAGNTYVLSLAYDNTVTDPASLNVWYRTGISGPFAPLGTSFQGTTAWSSGFATVGQYGVDTSSGTVWVVTDHNSQFVVVPEPSLGFVAGAGVVALAAAVARRRRTHG